MRILVSPKSGVPCPWALVMVHGGSIMDNSQVSKPLKYPALVCDYCCRKQSPPTRQRLCSRLGAPLGQRAVAEGLLDRAEGCQVERVFLRSRSARHLTQKSVRHLTSSHPIHPTFCDRALAQRSTQARAQALTRLQQESQTGGGGFRGL